MPPLKLDAVHQLIAERDLRMWWIAERLGRNRRTLHRWLTGATRNVPRKSIGELARLLRYEPHTITDSQEPERASRAAQLHAARTLIGGQLLQDLMPGHKFHEYEILAKGLLIPGLTQTDLGELYQRIAHALFRQSKLAEASEYANLANDIARELHDRGLLLRSNMLLSYFHYVAGDARACLRLDRKNLRDARQLDDPLQVAANLSNLGDQFAEFARYRRSELLQKHAIHIYQHLDVAASLAFCHLGLADLYRRWQRATDAWAALARARDAVQKVNFRRGYADCHRTEALLLMDRGDLDAALVKSAEAQSTYTELGIREARNFCHASIIHRVAGEIDEALDLIERGLEAVEASGVTIERANLRVEQYRTLVKRDGVPSAAAKKRLGSALSIFERAGYFARIASLEAEFGTKC